MILRRLKVIDKNGDLDCLYLLFYVSVAWSIAVPFGLFVALTVSGFATYRDEIIRANKTEQQKFIERIESIESDISAIKLHEGMRNIR